MRGVGEGRVSFKQPPRKQGWTWLQGQWDPGADRQDRERCDTFPDEDNHRSSLVPLAQFLPASMGCRSYLSTGATVIIVIIIIAAIIW